MQQLLPYPHDSFTLARERDFPNLTAPKKRGLMLRSLSYLKHPPTTNADMFITQDSYEYPAARVPSIQRSRRERAWSTPIPSPLNRITVSLLAEQSAHHSFERVKSTPTMRPVLSTPAPFSAPTSSSKLHRHHVVCSHCVSHRVGIASSSFVLQHRCLYCMVVLISHRVCIAPSCF